MCDTEGKTKHLFNDLLSDETLDVPEILLVLSDSVESGYIDWGKHRDLIIRILFRPKPEDLYQLITQSEEILKPLHDYVTMELYLNEQRAGTIDKYEFYKVTYRCNQLRNFLLTLKLH
jgi:hypothetical protein